MTQQISCVNPLEEVSEQMTDTTLANKSLEELFPGSLLSTPAVSIRISDPVSGAAILLPHHLETLTDSLVATRDDEPVGIIGGIEILQLILNDPSIGVLDNTKIGEVVCKKLIIVEPKTKLSELTKQWLQTRRAFAIIPNKYHGYSAISARKMLQIGISFKIDTPISSILRKDTVTFHKDNTTKDIISAMFNSNTRKLVLDGTTSFINDRIIIQKLAREFNCLRDQNDFLNKKSDIYDLDKAETVAEDTTISDACKIMTDMKSPYLIADGKVLSPWDIIMALSSS